MKNMYLTSKKLKPYFEEFIKKLVIDHQDLPEIDIILIGSNFSSLKYIQRKKDKANELGIRFNFYQVEYFEDASITFTNFKKIISKINSTTTKKGVILQYPIEIDGYKNDVQLLLDELYANKKIIDVDFLATDTEKLWQNQKMPPTILGIDLMLKNVDMWITYQQNVDNYNIFNRMWNQNLNFKNKNIVILGQGKLVGKPLMRYFLDREATIISINQYTSNAKELVKLGNIIITATGQKNLIDSTWLNSEGCVVIDASTSESNGKQTGDLNYNEIENSELFNKLTLIPSPNGIGPLTVLSIFYNLLTIKRN
jgi:methylenetetrahydrofolate dehydrogenase (NADP+) / methenyltetrahydrofolate cyclohydrolase